MSNVAFSKYLKELRTKKGLTQQELADALDVSLPSIKTIEAGKTSLPSSKLLESLSRFENESQENILTDIIFNDPSEHLSNLPKFLEHYIAWMYVRGYTFDLFPRYEYIVGLKEYPCIFTRKRESQVKILLDDLSRISGMRHRTENLNDLRQAMLDKIIELNDLENLPKIREYRFVFDALDKDQVEAFDLLSSVELGFVKENMTMELFDYKKYEVIKTHIFSGSPVPE